MLRVSHDITKLRPLFSCGPWSPLLVSQHWTLESCASSPADSSSGDHKAQSTASHAFGALPGRVLHTRSHSISERARSGPSGKAQHPTRHAGWPKPPSKVVLEGYLGEECSGSRPLSDVFPLSVENVTVISNN